MISAAELVREARRMIGVKYLHQGRSIETGVDCVGMGLAAAQRAGLDVLEFVGATLPGDYGRSPSPALMKLVQQHCRRLPALCPGALLVFKTPISRYPHHFAIYTDTGTMIHADGAQKQAVIEQTFGRPWSRALHSIWALPGVEYAL
jgi:cell wall-associated NlpC family hydrolase